MTWNPEQYHRYRAYRRRPFEDLLGGVLRRLEPSSLERPLRVVDLGCGSGELTAALHAALPGATTMGVDSSPAMLERARSHATAELSFVQADLVDWLDEPANGPWDLIFSNAALHWIQDQRALLERLRARLAPGGLLAVQVPANDHAVSHQTILEVVGESPFAEALDGFVRRTPVLAPQDYAVALDALGFEGIEVRLQVYPQHLDGPEDVFEWIRGSTLTPYASRLDEAHYAQLLDTVRERLLARLPEARPCFYPYDRILFWARGGLARLVTCS